MYVLRTVFCFRSFAIIPIGHSTDQKLENIYLKTSTQNYALMLYSPSDG